MPFIGASALAIATIRPGTRGLVGGQNTSSTPSGMTCRSAASTPKSVTMSRRLDSETVRILPTLRATLPCIRRKPYHRRRRELLAPVRAALEVDPPVEGDRVVDGRDQREPHPAMSSIP